MRCLALGLSLASFAVPMLAQSPPRLLADLETTPRPPRSSDPGGFARVGAWTLFAADDGVHGRELHRTAGNPLTTGMVADLRPGPEGSEPRGLTPVGARLLFFADDGVHGQEPWVSDGTAGGTRMLADLNPGIGRSSGGGLGVGSRAVFEASDGVASRLYGTDGTSAGTEVVLDLAASGAPDEVLLQRSAIVADAVQGAVRYFAARSGTAIELWRTDGTRVGTRPVIVHPAWGVTSSSAVQVAAGDGYPLVHVTVSSQAYELWRADGSTAVRLATFAGIGGTTGSWRFDGRLLCAYHVLLGSVPRLVATDGTPGGTAEVPLRAAIRGVLFLGESSGSLWMLGSTDDPAHVLLRLDPGMATPVEAASLPSLDRAQSPWMQIGSRFVYRSRSAIWALDPSAGLVRRLGDVVPTGWSWLGEGIGRAYFPIDDPAGGHELGVTDGTPAGTRLLADLNTTVSGNLGSAPTLFAALGQRAAFTATGASGLWDVWVTDGTAVGTQRLLAGLPAVYEMAALGDRLFFNAGDVLGDLGLYVTDGTPSGTSRVDSVAGPGLRAHPAPVPFGDVVLGFDQANLVASDGTGVRVVGPLPVDSAMPKPVRLGEQVFFQLDEGAGPGLGEVRAGLWTTDGTAAGTRRVGVYSSYYRGSIHAYTGLVAFRDRVYFVVYPSQSPFELWSSDGTAGGTRRIAVLPDTRTFDDIRLVAARDRVFVSWDQNLWSSDGSAQGTQRLPVNPWSGGALVAFDAGVLLDAWDHPGSGRDTLWFSDGSPAGTRPIRAGFERARWRNQEIFTAGARRAYFVADTFAPVEVALWTTDGTSAGTRRLTGPLPWGNPYTVGSAAFGGLLIVAAEDPMLGLEPHVIELGGTAQRLSGGCGGRGREATLDVTIGRRQAGDLELLGRASAGTVAIALLSAPPRAPTGFPAAGRCWLDVDANSVVELVSLPVVAGRFAHAFPLPDDPALYGLQAVIQAIVGPTDAPLGFDLTNGILLTVGP